MMSDPDQRKYVEAVASAHRIEAIYGVAWPQKN
jgi:hypothetical protein